MRFYSSLFAVLALTTSFAATAAREENQFVVEKTGSGCSLAVVPHREALDIKLSTPDTLVLQTSYDLIPGSGMKLKFSDGSEIQVGSLPDSNRRQTIGQLSPVALGSFSTNKKVTFYVESGRGPLYRRVDLRDFAASYAEFSNCLAR